MARRKKGGDATEKKKRKAVPLSLIDRKHAGKVVEPYRIMDEIREAHHPDLKEAKIAMAWHDGWRADADGRMKLGSLKKAGDLDRSLHSYDFILTLNKEAWNTFSDEQKRALIDHELCHGMRVVDANGEPKIDDKERMCYRIRKHDVEEFQDIIARHGTWKKDLESFVEAAKLATRHPLFPEEKTAAKRGKKAEEQADDSVGSILPLKQA